MNMANWFNFTTFDITGDLAFDESFNSLETGEFNDWIAGIFAVLGAAAFFQQMRRVPILSELMLYAFKNVPMLANATYKHEQATAVKAKRRLEKKTERKDFIR